MDYQMLVRFDLLRKADLDSISFTMVNITNITNNFAKMYFKCFNIVITLLRMKLTLSFHSSSTLRNNIKMFFQVKCTH